MNSTRPAGPQAGADSRKKQPLGLWFENAVSEAAVIESAARHRIYWVGKEKAAPLEATWNSTERSGRGIHIPLDGDDAVEATGALFGQNISHSRRRQRQGPEKCPTIQSSGTTTTASAIESRRGLYDPRTHDASQRKASPAWKHKEVASVLVSFRSGPVDGKSELGRTVDLARPATYSFSAPVAEATIRTGHPNDRTRSTTCPAGTSRGWVRDTARARRALGQRRLLLHLTVLEHTSRHHKSPTTTSSSQEASTPRWPGFRNRVQLQANPNYLGELRNPDRQRGIRRGRDQQRNWRALRSRPVPASKKSISAAPAPVRNGGQATGSEANTFRVVSTGCAGETKVTTCPSEKELREHGHHTLAVEQLVATFKVTGFSITSTSRSTRTSIPP